MGDFNLSNIIWTKHCNYHSQYSGVTGEAQTIFFDSLQECNLVQFNLSYNINNRLLDLVFSNIDLQVSACSHPLVPEDSHHKSLDIFLNLKQFDTLEMNSRNKYFFESGDYVKIKSFLNEVDWNDCLIRNSLEDSVSVFYEHLYSAIEKYIPHKFISTTSFPPWYNTALKKVLKEKLKFLHKHRIYGNSSDYDTFSLLRKRAKVLESECYKTYLKKCEDSIAKNPKLFWSFIKSNKKSYGTLPSSLSYEGQTASSGEDVCTLFSSYFQSTYLSSRTMQSDGSSVHDSLEFSNSINTISDIEIIPETVNKLLKSLDITKGAGPDHITPLFIIKCSDVLTKPLTLLFKRSLTDGMVPKIWKSAFITPIHKSGNKNNIVNYRPISKLCVFAKIFERLVYTQVYNTLSASFIDQQHGFLRNRSTTTNLLTFIDFTTSGMDSGGQVDSIFTDFSKAFDRIDHTLLLQKLLHAGIHGNLYRWFTSYIENRTQAVVLNGYMSSWNHTPSGVPQGSLLGPLLFNIFINDISACFHHSNFLLYADDMKVFKEINNENDCRILQQDLCRFEKYCHFNKLDLNLTKCRLMTFTRKTKITKFIYKLKDHELETVDEIRDLGVVHDSKLTYDKHVDSIVKKANTSMGFLLRTSYQFSSIKVIKILYCAYVRSILEYCSQIWNPQYDVYINRLESIQRRFLKHLQFRCKKYDADYESRCRRHHMLPLYERRKIADIALLTKIAQCQVDSPQLLSKISLKIPLRSVRQPRHLNVSHSFTKYRQNSFFIRSANLMNRLDGVPDLDIFNISPIDLKGYITKEWFDAIS